MAKRKRKPAQSGDVTISRAMVRKYQKEVDRQAERGGEYVGRAISTYMGGHPNATVAEVRKFTYELMQDALPNFTDLAETLSCDFMEDVAEMHGWGDVRPEIVRSTDYRLVGKRLHYLAGNLAEGDAEKYRRDVMDVTRFYIRRSAQDAMVENCGRAKLRFARVPSGFETCAFCFMLASRGFVYRSELTAGLGHDFHPNCNCTVVPGAKGRTAIDGYDPKGMAERWDACARTIGSRDPAEVMKEVATRDWHWLYTGEVPKVGFQNDEVKKDVRENRPHEEDSAGRVARHGITPVLMQDYEEYYDENGIQQRRGLADLIKGVELKTLGADEDKPGASTYNTINGYIKRSSKRKKNMKLLIFDNSQNDEMEDDELVAHIRKSQAFRRGRIYILDHEEKYRFIR